MGIDARGMGLLIQAKQVLGSDLVRPGVQADLEDADKRSRHGEYLGTVQASYFWKQFDEYMHSISDNKYQDFIIFNEYGRVLRLPWSPQSLLDSLLSSKPSYRGSSTFLGAESSYAYSTALAKGIYYDSHELYWGEHRLIDIMDKASTNGPAFYTKEYCADFRERIGIVRRYLKWNVAALEEPNADNTITSEVDPSAADPLTATLISIPKTNLFGVKVAYAKDPTRRNTVSYSRVSDDWKANRFEGVNDYNWCKRSFTSDDSHDFGMDHCPDVVREVPAKSDIPYGIPMAASADDACFAHFDTISKWGINPMGLYEKYRLYPTEEWMKSRIYNPLTVIATIAAIAFLRYLNNLWAQIMYGDEFVEEKPEGVQATTIGDGPAGMMAPVSTVAMKVLSKIGSSVSINKQRSHHGDGNPHMDMPSTSNANLAKWLNPSQTNLAKQQGSTTDLANDGNDVRQRKGKNAKSNTNLGASLGANLF